MVVNGPTGETGLALPAGYSVSQSANVAGYWVVTGGKPGPNETAIASGVWLFDANKKLLGKVTGLPIPPAQSDLYICIDHKTANNDLVLSVSTAGSSSRQTIGLIHPPSRQFRQLAQLAEPVSPTFTF